MTTLHSVDDLVEWLGTQKSARILGIVGPPGSGKSTLASTLIDRLGESAVLVPMDGFHYPQATLVELGRRERMGAPDTFDSEGFATKLAEVASGKPEVWFPSFDRTIEEPVENQILVTAWHEWVVVEGNYLLLEDHGWDLVGSLLDLSIYLDIPDSLRRERLIARHVEFGKTLEQAETWVNEVDEPNALLIALTAQLATARLNY